MGLVFNAMEIDSGFLQLVGGWTGLLIFFSSLAHMVHCKVHTLLPYKAPSETVLELSRDDTGTSVHGFLS